jgi:ATP-binding cassette subfamily F protein 3
VEQGHLVEIGYLDQHLNLLREDLPVIRAVWPKPDPEVNEKQMRDLLARFGLMGDIVHQTVGALSGGERSRACLAKIVALGVNVLVLDEPTNHLDLWARDSLEAALREFEGTVVVVSHDRYFLNQVADVLVVLEGNGQSRVVHGNYDTYERMRLAWISPPSPATGARAKKPEPTPSGPTPKPAKRKRQFPYRKITELEADIATLETRIREYEESLASADLYRDPARLKETMQAFEEGKVTLARLYEHWEEAVELNG